jgi:hypothetical protein
MQGTQTTINIDPAAHEAIVEAINHISSFLNCLVICDENT